MEEAAHAHNSALNTLVMLRNINLIVLNNADTYSNEDMLIQANEVMKCCLIEFNNHLTGFSSYSFSSPFKIIRACSENLDLQDSLSAQEATRRLLKVMRSSLVYTQITTLEMSHLTSGYR